MNRFIVTVVLLVGIVAISILQVSFNTTLLKRILGRTTLITTTATEYYYGTTTITTTEEEDAAVVVTTTNTTTNSSSSGSSGTMTTTSTITSDDGVVTVSNVTATAAAAAAAAATTTTRTKQWPLFDITYPHGMSGGFIHLGKSGGSTISSTQLINHCHSIFKKNPNQWKQFCNCTDGIVTTTRNSISCNNTEYYKTKSTVGIMIEDYYHGKFKQNVAIKREEEEEEEE